MSTLTVATYNIHKGFSYFNQRVVLHELRDRLRELNADIVFLQEVQGEHNCHSKKFANYPDGAQHEFIAGRRWPHSAYGKNAIYAEGHHGNAILSRMPIVQTLNTDISAHRFESRGLLHCEIDLGLAGQVHCVCAHFGLFAKGRRSQTAALIDYVLNKIPLDEPVIIAGDFNDWRNKVSYSIAKELGMHDVFNVRGGGVARSFPARMPMLRLDRIYVRGFNVLHGEVHVGGVWQRLSDHAALSARLELNA
ncbi:MAG: endonuclease/exonuclease/phosphatase family protein [Gallionella sp.]